MAPVTTALLPGHVPGRDPGLPIPASSSFAHPLRSVPSVPRQQAEGQLSGGSSPSTLTLRLQHPCPPACRAGREPGGFPPWPPCRSGWDPPGMPLRPLRRQRDSSACWTLALLGLGHFCCFTRSLPNRQVPWQPAHGVFPLRFGAE